jgi:hypothetical protein
VNETLAAALFLSHLTLVLIWLTWITLFRRLRIDFLRARLRSLLFELTRIPITNAAAHSRLSQIVQDSIVSAEHLTLTRLVLCRIWARLMPPSAATLAGHDDVLISAVEKRLMKLIADHTCGGLPLVSSLLPKRLRDFELMLESCTTFTPAEITRIARISQHENDSMDSSSQPAR